MATPEADGWRLIGVWSLDCDAGASFDSGGTALIADEPGAGEVLRGASPRSTVRCFAQHCALPDGACIRERDDRFYLERCSDGEALSAAYMRVPGRPVRGPGSAPVAPLASAPTRPAAAGSTPAIELPTPPGGDCDLPPVLRAEAARRVGIAQSHARAGRLPHAVSEYQAGLSMDRCSAAAWSGLGQAAYWLGDADVASRALAVGLSLAPGDAAAWTALGAAHEALGRYAEATSAYQQALALDPNRPAARSGLNRVAGRR